MQAPRRVVLSLRVTHISLLMFKSRTFTLNVKIEVTRSCAWVGRKVGLVRRGTAEKDNHRHNSFVQRPPLSRRYNNNKTTAVPFRRRRFTRVFEIVYTIIYITVVDVRLTHANVNVVALTVRGGRTPYTAHPREIDGGF